MQTVEGKPLSMVGPPTHLSHLGSLSAVSRGPLEPPKISKPWSLSCLRPAPPLKPSAALGYKEVGGLALHKQTHTHLLCISYKQSYIVSQEPQDIYLIYHLSVSPCVYSDLH